MLFFYQVEQVERLSLLTGIKSINYLLEGVRCFAHCGNDDHQLLALVFF
jgi:hypothetical protein